MNEIASHLGEMASLIGSLTVVGGALMWVYHKLIGNPREKRKQRAENERQEKQLKMIQKENEPLIKTIDQLKEWLDDSRRDREKLNEVAERNTEKLRRHKEIIDDHDDRLIILESKNGLRYDKKRGGD